MTSWKIFFVRTSSNCCWKASLTTVTDLQLPKQNYPYICWCTWKLYAIYSQTILFVVFKQEFFLLLFSIRSPVSSLKNFEYFYSVYFFYISFIFSIRVVYVCFAFFAICLQSIAAGTHFRMQLDTLIVVFDAIAL